MKLRLLFVVCVAFSCGCSATGPKFTEYRNSLRTLPDDKSRIYVFRATESSLAAGRSASLKIDGNSLGKCAHKGFNIFEVPPGLRTLKVEIWDSPGSCSIEFKLASSKEYYFEISPRKEFFDAGSTGVVLMGGVGGLIAGAAESSGKVCGGPFSIQAVESAVAEKKMRDLRFTD